MEESTSLISKPDIKSWPLKLKLKLKEYRRVLSITKKPGKEEYFSIAKVTGAGILLIGAIGFAIFIITVFIS